MKIGILENDFCVYFCVHSPRFYSDSNYQFLFLFLRIVLIFRPVLFLLVLILAAAVVVRVVGVSTRISSFSCEWNEGPRMNQQQHQPWQSEQSWWWWNSTLKQQPPVYQGIWIPMAPVPCYELLSVAEVLLSVRKASMVVLSAPWFLLSMPLFVASVKSESSPVACCDTGARGTLRYLQRMLRSACFPSKKPTI